MIAKKPCRRLLKRAGMSFNSTNKLFAQEYQNFLSCLPAIVVTGDAPTFLRKAEIPKRTNKDAHNLYESICRRVA